MKRLTLPLGVIFLLTLLLGTAQAIEAGFPGATVVRAGKPVPIQNSADELRPRLKEAKEDRGSMYEDGCLVTGSTTESPVCEYGNPGSGTQIVLFGDSRAAQYFPALEPIAQQRDWKLTVLTRGLCSFAEISQSRPCNQWRSNSIQRIRELSPALVIVSTSTEYFRDNGGVSSIPRLTRITAKTISKLKATGAKVVLMRSLSLTPYRSPTIPADCIARNMKRLRLCGWEPNRKGHEFDLLAARQRGVKVVDTESRFCRKTICPAVIGNVITFRDGQHYSATFAESFSPWLKKQLPSAP